jgi:uroporphyrinogen-III synthase
MNLTNGSLDLKLEAVGFSTKQVEAYIRKLPSHDSDKPASILAFVHKHEVIEGAC